MESNPFVSQEASPLCPQCGGECEPQRVTLPLKRSLYGFVLIRNVPAEVCQRCGEAQFSLPMTNQMMNALHSGRTPDEIALIPIYDFSGSIS